MPLKATSNGNITENEKLGFYQLVYGLLMLSTVLLAAINVFFFTGVTLNAACKLHNKMFKRVKCRRQEIFSARRHQTLACR